MENTEYLRTVYMFRELTSLELVQVNKVLRTLRVPKGESIIEEGAAGDMMYIIKKGAVDIYKGEGLSKRKLTHLLPGAHFGEIALIERGSRSAGAVALDDCELLTLKRSDLEGFLERNEGIALKFYRAFTRALCDRLRQSNENLLVAHQMQDS